MKKMMKQKIFKQILQGMLKVDLTLQIIKLKDHINNKTMKSMDCKQTCENGRSEEIIYKIEEIKCNNMMKEYKM